MSHAEQQRFFKSLLIKFPELFHKKTHILEVGSLDINGSLREIFTEHESYLGCDLAPGNGVDIVSRAHELILEAKSFDACLSAECFEHDEYWDLSFRKMIKLTKSGGLVAFSCATTGRLEHGTSRTDAGSSPFTNDYYNNLTQKDFELELDLDEFFDSWEFSVDEGHCDLYFWGVVS